MTWHSVPRTVKAQFTHLICLPQQDSNNVLCPCLPETFAQPPLSCKLPIQIPETRAPWQPLSISSRMYLWVCTIRYRWRGLCTLVIILISLRLDYNLDISNSAVQLAWPGPEMARLANVWSWGHAWQVIDNWLSIRLADLWVFRWHSASWTSWV